MPGGTMTDISFKKETAVVSYVAAKVTVAQMVEAIRLLDYTATPHAARWQHDCTWCNVIGLTTSGRQ